MTRRTWNVLPVIMLVALPSVAHADVGTPLMWAGFLHLVFGNSVIGLLEGWLLAKVFALPRKRSIVLLILANYFSAWVGGLFLPHAIGSVLPWELHNVWFLFWLMVLVTYILTLVLEFPFVALAFRGDASWCRKSIVGSVLIQSASHLLLAGWYWSASATSLFTETKVVDLSDLSLPAAVTVYFISAKDGDVYAGPIGEDRWQKVCDLNSTSRWDSLLVQRSSSDDNHGDIVACLRSEAWGDPRYFPVREGLTSATIPTWRDTQWDRPRGGTTWYGFGAVPYLGDAKSSPWNFRAGGWAGEGLSGSDARSKRRVTLALETPFISWVVRNATQLPDDLVLFQFGDNQICVYDPEGNRIALLARGRGPLAVIGAEVSSNDGESRVYR